MKQYYKPLCTRVVLALALFSSFTLFAQAPSFMLSGDVNLPYYEPGKEYHITIQVTDPNPEEMISLELTQIENPEPRYIFTPALPLSGKGTLSTQLHVNLKDVPFSGWVEVVAFQATDASGNHTYYELNLPIGTPPVIYAPEEPVFICINQPFHLEFDYQGSVPAEDVHVQISGWPFGNRKFEDMDKLIFEGDKEEFYAGPEDVGTHQLMLWVTDKVLQHTTTKTVTIKVVDCATTPVAWDKDGDGYGGELYNNQYHYTSEGLPALVMNKQDCNDHDAAVYPGAGGDKDCPAPPVIYAPEEPVFICINQPFHLEFDYQGWVEAEDVGVQLVGFAAHNWPFGHRYFQDMHVLSMVGDKEEFYAGPEDVGTYQLVLTVTDKELQHTTTKTVTIKVVDCATTPVAWDKDGDGYGGELYNNQYHYTSEGLPALVMNNKDCNDHDAAVYPGAGGENDCPAGNEAAGLAYYYYHGNWTMLPDFSTLEPEKSGIVENFNLSPRTQNDHFGFMFKGWISIATAGTYTFYTKSDDGSALYIGNQMVVNNDGIHGWRERSGTIYLTAGKHPIRVGYFERTGTYENLMVSWAGPGFAKQVIPDAVLSHYNQNPIANAGPDFETEAENGSVLHGAGTDPDGTIVAYKWRFISGPSIPFNTDTNQPTLSIADLEPGIYVYELTVTDNLGATDSDTVRVHAYWRLRGLRYSYYHGNWSMLPNFSSMEPEKTGIIDYFSLTPRTQDDHFGFVFRGEIWIEETGTHTFTTRSDDGSKLFIDGHLVVNNDGIHGLRNASGAIYLTQGYHDIEVQYFERTGSVENLMVYFGSGYHKYPISAELLNYRYYGTEPATKTAANNLATKAAPVDEASTESLSSGALRLLQNPVTNGTLRLQTNAKQGLQEGEVLIIDVSGKKFVSRLQAGASSDNWEVNTRQLKAGLYMLLLQSSDGQQHRIRFVQE